MRAGDPVQQWAPDVGWLCMQDGSRVGLDLDALKSLFNGHSIPS